MISEVEERIREIRKSILDNPRQAENDLLSLQGISTEFEQDCFRRTWRYLLEVKGDLPYAKSR